MFHVRTRIARKVAALLTLFAFLAAFAVVSPARAAITDFNPAAQSSYTTDNAAHVDEIRIDTNSLNAFVRVRIRNINTQNNDGDNDFGIIQVYPNGTSWSSVNLGPTLLNQGGMQTRTVGGVTSTWKCLGNPTCERFYDDGNGFTAVEFQWRKADGSNDIPTSQTESFTFSTPTGSGVCYDIVISSIKYNNWSVTDNDTYTVFDVGDSTNCPNPYM